MRRRVVATLWNGRTRRPRLPWRIVAAFVVLAGLSLTLAIVDPFLRRFVETAFGLLASEPLASAAAGSVVFVSTQAIVFVGAVSLTGRFVDRRQFRDFGLHVDRGWWTDFGFGIALGAALMTGIFLMALAAGWIVVTGSFRIDQPAFGFWPWFTWSLVVFVVIGVTEEILARGYLIKNLSEGLTWFDRIDAGGAVALATLGSSLIFTGGHVTNPNAGIASTVGILVASVMLAAGFVLTGELSIPIGIHVTWNFFQGPVYGFPVSGVDVGISILAVEQRGHTTVTGGTFGPEAGVLGFVASVVGIGFIVAWVYRREGRVVIAPSLTKPDLRTDSDE